MSVFKEIMKLVPKDAVITIRHNDIPKFNDQAVISIENKEKSYKISGGVNSGCTDEHLLHEIKQFAQIYNSEKQRQHGSTKSKDIGNTKA